MILHKLLKAEAYENSTELKKMKSEITWHKYPDEKPQKKYTDEYIICFCDKAIRRVATGTRRYFPSTKSFDYTDNEIIYWAELPEAYENSTELKKMKSEITWHKYPDERPQKKYTDEYIICFYDKDTRRSYVSTRRYSPLSEEFNYSDDIITHWAELPKLPKE